MYGINSWYICPIFLIPFALIWAALELLCEKKNLCQRIADKHGWRKRAVKKWIHSITGLMASLIAFILIALISLLIGFDLFSWETI